MFFISINFHLPWYHLPAHHWWPPFVVAACCLLLLLLLLSPSVIVWQCRCMSGLAPVSVSVSVCRCFCSCCCSCSISASISVSVSVSLRSWSRAHASFLQKKIHKKQTTLPENHSKTQCFFFLCCYSVCVCVCVWASVQSVSELVNDGRQATATPAASKLFIKDSN